MAVNKGWFGGLAEIAPSGGFSEINPVVRFVAGVLPFTKKEVLIRRIKKWTEFYY